MISHASYLGLGKNIGNSLYELNQACMNVESIIE